MACTRSKYIFFPEQERGIAMMICDSIHPKLRAALPAVYIMRLSTWKRAATEEAADRAMPKSIAWKRQTGPGKLLPSLFFILRNPAQSPWPQAPQSSGFSGFFGCRSRRPMRSTAFDARTFSASRANEPSREENLLLCNRRTR